VLQAPATQVDASATLELLMVSFENPDGKAADDDRCDIGSQCDHKFKFSLYRGDRYGPTLSETT